MSFNNPAFLIPRRPVFQPAGEVGVWEKMSPMFPQATQSPATPEFLDLNNLPTFVLRRKTFQVQANPVSEVMAAAGFRAQPSPPHAINPDLMHGEVLPGWDGTPLTFFLFRDNLLKPSQFATPVYPGPTFRVPRGAVFHADSHGDGPPPHTIHWHGIDPTPINDGVGHCSMEIGNYTYQWQPNSIGTYFYHCHRNTVQHFEFGLFGLLLIDPPDAFFASIASTSPDGSVLLNNVPIGNGRPEPGFPNGRRRTAANLVTPFGDFRKKFPGFVGGNAVNGVFVPDPQGQFPTDPHAFTVPYDVEAFWVFDDRDSVWSQFAPDPFAFFPRNGNDPGVDDEFKIGFFNDYNADFWFITGVPVPGPPGSTVAIDPSGARPAGGGLPMGPRGVGVIPPQLNSGVANTQVAISAKVNETLLIRSLDAAYNSVRITFPVDVLVMGFDGRALGVPPFGRYNNAFLLPANTPILICTARRFDVLVNSKVAVNAFVKAEFIDSQGIAPDPTSNGVLLGPVLQTALIPFVISG